MKYLSINPKLIVSILLLIIFSTGCSFRSSKDITNRPEFQELRGKCLELKRDVFLVQYSDTKEYTLHVPGGFSSMPPTIEAYINNPNAWKKEIDKVVGIVPSGTKLHIYNIVHISGQTTSIKSYFAQLDDPRLISIPIDVLFLLR